MRGSAVSASLSLSLLRLNVDNLVNLRSFGSWRFKPKIACQNAVAHGRTAREEVLLDSKDGFGSFAALIGRYETKTSLIGGFSSLIARES